MYAHLNGGDERERIQIGTAGVGGVLFNTPAFQQTLTGPHVWLNEIQVLTQARGQWNAHPAAVYALGGDFSRALRGVCVLASQTSEGLE